MGKIKTLVLLCALLVFGCAGSRTSTETANQTNETIEAEAGKHFFWKVSDENSSVWILGSIHFGDESFYPMDSVIENAFDSATELATEINMSDESVSSEVATKMVRQGVLPAGTTLNQVLPRTMWNTLDSLCAAWNIPPTMLIRMRPWFAATTLSTIAIQRTGIDPSLGVDAVLMARAADEGKTIVGLETADEQVNAIADDTDDSDSAGIFYLKSTLREISELDSMVTRMIRAWKTGDAKLLQEAMGNDEVVDAADSILQKKMEEKVYTSRNEKMAESVAGFLAEDRNVFVVVGVAHLALDEDNVISLLKRKGFKVERF